jgi:hypothetical protein
MTRVTWNAPGERIFEVGLDRGVLYPASGVPGVPWNGLTSVDQTSSGQKPTPHYYDGQKYLDYMMPEEFAGKIEAFMYPDEFSRYDGYYEHHASGLFLGQQQREVFHLTYRTLIGNDTHGTDFAYKIHMLFNCLATPSAKTFKTVNANVELAPFSWDITTTPPPLDGYRPTAHLVMDSRKVNSDTLRIVEDYLYGIEGREPMIFLPADWLDFMDANALELEVADTTGLWPMHLSLISDLSPTVTPGVFDIPADSRLSEESAGLYTLEEDA